MNSIQSLHSKPFHLRPLEEKIEIKKLGRPTPSINLSQTVISKHRQYTRVFNTELFKKHDWLCSCDVKHALFCFPCVLFGGEKAWTSVGMVDIQHLHDRIKKHETSCTHQKNVLNLAFIGNANIGTQMDSAYRRSVEIHNQKVAENRYILHIIINSIRFCGCLELALRGYDETDTSSNPDVFQGLINFSTELDSVLESHLEKSTVFKGTSKSIQNELLMCMLDVYHEEVGKEIKNADFLGIICDETTDVLSTYQLVMVYRYIVNNKPVERFWDFIVPLAHDTSSLAVCIIDQLNVHIENNPNKLIAQTYDGASVMRGSSCGVQTLVKQKFPHAAYVHCYAHQLNSIMMNATSAYPSARIFLSNLQGICTFISISPQRIKLLGEIVNKQLPGSVPIRWNFHSRSINTVYEYRKEIIECLKAIQGVVHGNPITVSQASGFIKLLKSKTFVFWLSFFQRVMVHVDILFNQMQKGDLDPTSAKTFLKTFQEAIINIKQNIDVCFVHELPQNKKRKLESVKEEKRIEAIDICDLVVQQAYDRFKFNAHLSAALLFLPEKFKEYYTKFPEDHFKDTLQVYTILDAKKLRTELTAIYERYEFRNTSGAVSLFEFIKTANLEETFSECVKLLKVLTTIPMSTSESERCFSTLKRIKTFLRNSMGQERLSALAMLSVERDFILQIPDFNQRVIDKFAAMKTKRMDFLFK